MAGKNQPEQPSTEVDVIQDVVGTLVAREGDAIGRYLRTEEEVTDVAASASYESIIGEIMGAESIDDVLNLPEPSKLDDWVGKPIEIGGWAHRESDFEAGAPVYFTVVGTDMTTGKRLVINTGEQAVMAQLLKLRELNAFPCRVMVQASGRPNRFGKQMHRLTKADAHNG